MSNVGFTARAFYRMPLRTDGGMGFVASVATREATGDSTRDGGGIVSFFYRFETEAVALVSAPDLFLEDTPPRVFTILRLSHRKKTKIRNGGFDFERQR